MVTPRQEQPDTISTGSPLHRYQQWREANYRLSSDGQWLVREQTALDKQLALGSLLTHLDEEGTAMIGRYESMYPDISTLVSDTKIQEATMPPSLPESLQQVCARMDADDITFLYQLDSPVAHVQENPLRELANTTTFGDQEEPGLINLEQKRERVFLDSCARAGAEAGTNYLGTFPMLHGYVDPPSAMMRPVRRIGYKDGKIVQGLKDDTLQGPAREDVSNIQDQTGQDVTYPLIAEFDEFGKLVKDEKGEPVWAYCNLCYSTKHTNADCWVTCTIRGRGLDTNSEGLPYACKLCHTYLHPTERCDLWKYFTRCVVCGDDKHKPPFCPMRLTQHRQTMLMSENKLRKLCEGCNCSKEGCTYKCYHAKDDLKPTETMAYIGTNCNDCAPGCVCCFQLAPKKYCSQCGQNVEENPAHLRKCPEAPTRESPCEFCGLTGHDEEYCRYYLLREDPQQPARCVICDNDGHLPKDCSQYDLAMGQQVRAQYQQCNLCAKIDHTAENCPTAMCPPNRPQLKEHCYFCGSTKHHHLMCNSTNTRTVSRSDQTHKKAPSVASSGRQTSQERLVASLPPIPLDLSPSPTPDPAKHTSFVHQPQEYYWDERGGIHQSLSTRARLPQTVYHTSEFPNRSMEDPTSSWQRDELIRLEQEKIQLQRIRELELNQLREAMKNVTLCTPHVGPHPPDLPIQPANLHRMWQEEQDLAMAKEMQRREWERRDLNLQQQAEREVAEKIAQEAAQRERRRLQQVEEENQRTVEQARFNLRREVAQELREEGQRLAQEAEEYRQMKARFAAQVASNQAPTQTTGNPFFISRVLPTENDPPEEPPRQPNRLPSRGGRSGGGGGGGSSDSDGDGSDKEPGGGNFMGIPRRKSQKKPKKVVVESELQPPANAQLATAVQALVESQQALMNYTQNLNVSQQLGNTSAFTEAQFDELSGQLRTIADGSAQKTSETIPMHDGEDKKSFLDWLNNVEDTCVLFRMEPLRTATLRSSGPLRQILAKYRTGTTWKTIRDELIRQFSPYPTIHHVTEALNELVQGAECLQTFINRYTRLYQLADYRDLQDIKSPTVISDFLRSLRNVRLAEQVQKKNPNTLAATMAWALQLEVPMQKQEGLRLYRKATTTGAQPKKKHVLEVRQTQAAPSISSSIEMSDLVEMVTDDEGNQRPAYEVMAITAGKTAKDSTCYQCGQTGHWSWNCNQPRKDSRDGRPSGPPVQGRLNTTLTASTPINEGLYDFLRDVLATSAKNALKTQQRKEQYKAAYQAQIQQSPPTDDRPRQGGTSPGYMDTRNQSRKPAPPAQNQPRRDDKPTRGGAKKYDFVSKTAPKPADPKNTGPPKKIAAVSYRQEDEDDEDNGDSYESSISHQIGCISSALISDSDESYGDGDEN